MELNITDIELNHIDNINTAINVIGEAYCNIISEQLKGLSRTEARAVLSKELSKVKQRLAVLHLGIKQELEKYILQETESQKRPREDS